MKNLIIIGVGIFSNIIYEYARISKSYGVDWVFKGFLYGNADSEEDKNDKFLLGNYSEYEINADDVFFSSYIGNKTRKEAYETIKAKGGAFVNVIHPSANIFSSVKMGEGNFVGAFATISANVQLGNANIIQDHCNIGHDSTLGDFNHLFVNSILCGKNKIDEGVSIYTSSTIYPKLKIGHEAIVASGSVVVRNVKDSQSVAGNPAKKIE